MESKLKKFILLCIVLIIIFLSLGFTGVWDPFGLKKLITKEDSVISESIPISTPDTNKKIDDMLMKATLTTMSSKSVFTITINDGIINIFGPIEYTITKFKPLDIKINLPPKSHDVKITIHLLEGDVKFKDSQLFTYGNNIIPFIKDQTLVTRYFKNWNSTFNDGYFNITGLYYDIYPSRLSI
jgi:hypothetical protein